MNTDTKRHIDAARQVLVGVVPNPTSQIDQITYALMYKFMDDMDQAAIKNGDEAAFFTGDLEPYSWARLMDSKMGNQERLNLYIIAFQKFTEAKQLPELFRNILKSAFLPYRSPETLGLFLKEINYFDYSHPEELGNAYEYLLSIMGSQGDAGQFRTPRHIIDFIVNVVNPTKDDKVLDPACGTGGFLVSSYRHILEQHDGKNDPDKKEKPLTPDERRKLMENFEGYDIDTTMVRIAQVNMYLHQFKNPKIFQYDSLSSDERWNDKFDVILANPPFMSPKGGIKPHSKFSIQSNRSEVLFVDYIMNHLRPKGRAGVIVPEGIIFQSGTAHKQLRKSLVDDGLYAVVSLPGGVFQPYSGVKTSILLFNSELAKQKDEIVFVKVENDGFDLGAQRRESSKNDLPEALNILDKWNTGEKAENKLAVYVEKSRIAESGDYNLSSDRYRINTDYSNTKWPLVGLGKVIKINFGERITKNNQSGTKYPVYGGGGESFRTNEFNRENEYVISRFAMSENCVRFVDGQFWLMDSGGTFSINKEYENAIEKDYIGYILLSRQNDIFMCARGGAQKNLDAKQFYELEIPLPPLEIQNQIVTELDGYQNIIAGAKQIVSSWKPKIDIDPGWEKVKLGEVCEIKSGGTPPTGEVSYYENGNIPWLKSGVCKNEILTEPKTFITEKGLENSSVKWFIENTTLIALVGATIGKTALIKFKATTNQNVAGLYPKNLKQLNPVYLYLISQTLYDFFIKLGNGGFKMANLSFVKNLEIPLPPLEIQKQIVEKIETERTMVGSAKKLIEVYEQKTKDTIAKLWGEENKVEKPVTTPPVTVKVRSDKERQKNKDLIEKLRGWEDWYVFQPNSEPGKHNLTDLAHNLGFNSYSDFWTWFKSLSIDEIKGVSDKWCSGDCCQSILKRLLELAK